MFKIVNFGGLNLTDINSCLASELVISLSFQSRDLSSRIYVPAKVIFIKIDSIFFTHVQGYPVITNDSLVNTGL